MCRLLARWLLALPLLLAALGRGAETPVIPGTADPAILVFGDSISAGYGLPQGKGWADLLQQRIDQERYRYRVVNTSISGETTLGGRNRLAQVLAQFHPHVVIIELGPNDALRGQPLDAMRDNLVSMVRACRVAKANVLLVGMRIPPNYGPDYTEKFYAAFQAVAKTMHVPLVPFLLEGFAERRDMFQADGIHPGVAAQSLMLDNVWKQLQPILTRPAQKH
jgi:acyl-CoA thioesterase-1